jgi:alanyl-tRNA synthetase
MKSEIRYYDTVTAAPVQAEILEIKPLGDALAVILDKAVFYPGGGGQSADRGTINGEPLLDVREEAGEILNIVSASAGLKTGPVSLCLDAARRRDFTVQHTAQHLLAGTILRLYGAPTVSMHLSDSVNTVDIDRRDFSPEELLAIEEAAADSIEADLPVITHLCPPEDLASFPLRKIPPQGEEVVRVVEIKGCDFSPCCGTHLPSTGGIGCLRVLKVEKYKGMSRFHFIAGRRVLRSSRALWEQAERISRALSVPVEETAAGVAAFIEKNAALERRLAAFEEKAALSRAGELVSGEGDFIVRLYPDLDMAAVLQTGKAAQRLSEKVFVLGSEKEKKFTALTSRKDIDLKSLFKVPLEKYGGSGGGGPAFFQGNFQKTENLQEFLKSLENNFRPGGL